MLSGNVCRVHDSLARLPRTTILEISWRGSVTSPVGFHDGQLQPDQSHFHPMSPKIPCLHLDVCQNAIDLLNRDRKPDWPPVKMCCGSVVPSDFSFARRRIFSSMAPYLSKMRSQEYDFSNCNHGLRTDRFASMAEAIGTNHGVLDAPTINASCYQAHAPYLSSQFSESFADQQSFAALTKHRSSFYHTSAHRPQAVSHAERIDVVRGPSGKVRVAVVPCFGAETKSKRPFKTFIRSRIVRRPIFEERTLPVPAGCGPATPQDRSRSHHAPRSEAGPGRRSGGPSPVSRPHASPC